MAAYLISEHQVSITRACAVISLSKSMFYYQSVKDDTVVEERLQQLAHANVREGRTSSMTAYVQKA